MNDIKSLIFELVGGATITALFVWLIWSCFEASSNAILSQFNFWNLLEMALNHF